MRVLLEKRTKKIGIEIIKMVENLPNKQSAWTIGRQLIRSAVSIGANYRASKRAKSDADFINKLKIVEEETDETLYWLEILEESQIIDESLSKNIKVELNEILSIIVATLNTMRKKMLLKETSSRPKN